MYLQSESRLCSSINCINTHLFHVVLGCKIECQDLFALLNSPILGVVEGQLMRERNFLYKHTFYS